MQRFFFLIKWNSIDLYALRLRFEYEKFERAFIEFRVPMILCSSFCKLRSEKYILFHERSYKHFAPHAAELALESERT